MEELLFHNARVHTLDPHRPQAAEVWVRGERIAAVGAGGELQGRGSREARRIDLGGATLVPGFNDNHIHTVSMGDYLTQPNLRGLDAGQIVDLLRERYAGAEPGRTLYALGWDYPACPHPHRSLLDEAFPENPVVLVQFSGHGMWLNSLALRRYGVDRDTPDPPGGSILRDERGEPTGILRDKAAEAVHATRFREMHSDRSRHRRLLERSLGEFRRTGLTSVQDNSWFYVTVRALNRLRREERLSCRFSCWFYGMRPDMARIMQLCRFDHRWVRRGPWKYLLDGTFSTRTAWLLEPYADEPGNRGQPGVMLGQIDAILATAARRRRQLAFHAIGDRTIRELLDAVERAGGAGLGPLRLRIEHAQLIHPGDIPRLRRLGVLVCAQPNAIGTPEKDARLLGEERARRAYSYRSLLEEGVRLSFGSDMPGEATFHPLQGVHDAVNREGSERITPLQALSAYTLGSAYAEFQEGEKGSIEAGKLADLAVLSQDPLAVAPERIRDIQVIMTVVGGRVVFPEPAG
jgi:predicted amidohydrolase YtcJ